MNVILSLYLWMNVLAGFYLHRCLCQKPWWGCVAPASLWAGPRAVHTAGAPLLGLEVDPLCFGPQNRVHLLLRIQHGRHVPPAHAALCLLSHFRKR